MVPAFPFRRPAFLACICFVAGIAAAKFWNPPIWLLFTVSFLLLSALAALLRYGKKESRREGIFMVLTLTLILGSLRYEWYEKRWVLYEQEAMLFSKSGRVVIKGDLDGFPETPGYGRGLSFPLTNVTVSTDQRTYQLSSKVLIWSAFPLDSTPVFNERVRSVGRLEPIRAASLPGQADFQALMASKGIHGQVRVYKEENLQFLGREDFSTFSALRQIIFSIRVKIITTFKENIPSPWAEFLISMFLGDVTDLPGYIREDMLRTGIYHIVSVSGLHTTMLVSSFLFGLKFIGLRRRQAAIVALPSLFFFLCLVGWSSPAVRASILSAGLLFGLLFEKDVDSLNMLGVSALLVLGIAPSELFQVGFQLSYTAVFFLITLTPVFDKAIPFKGVWARRFGQAITVSLAAYLSTAPIIAYYFGRTTPISILANIPTIPLVWLGMVGGTALSISACLGGVFAHPIGYVLQFVMASLEGVTHWFSKMDYACLSVGRPGALMLGFFYLLLLAMTATRDSLRIVWRKIRLGRPHILLFLLVAFAWGDGLEVDKDVLRAWFFSLGSGDSILVRTPGGGTMLVDGGAPDSSDRKGGDPKLVSSLRALRIERIDCLVLTHADTDHVGELKAVVERFPVQLFVTSSLTAKGESFDRLKEALQKKNVPMKTAQAGDVFEGFPNVTMKVLSPDASLVNTPEVKDNEIGLVIQIRYGEIDMLLTDDATEKVERRLLERGVELRSEILKVAHHGSKNASTADFLAKVSPEVSIIEVGRNSYGHPHREALQRLQKCSRLVLRTDKDGTVEIETNGRDYRVLPSSGRAAYQGSPN